MTAPVQTPNAATTTKPERSSRRVARKAPLRWLPWLLLLLLALLVAGIVAAVVAANDGDDTGTSSSTGSSSSSDLSAVSAGALVGGAGNRPTGAATTTDARREAGTAGTVLFAEASAELDADARAVIAQAVQNLRAASVRRVEVIGYTDVLAGQPVNKALSQRRADAVAQELRAALPGVEVITSAKGEAEPVASNSTDQGRQQNRRAAIVARG